MTSTILDAKEEKLIHYIPCMYLTPADPQRAGTTTSNLPFAPQRASLNVCS